MSNHSIAYDSIAQLSLCPRNSLRQNFRANFTGRREDRSATTEGTSSTYTRGFFVGSEKEWYHGELTRYEAEQALKASGCDCFLIRHCQGVLVLSLIHDGEFHHVTIQYESGSYELENGSAKYNHPELAKLIDYYRNNPISYDLSITLGPACEKPPGIIQ